MFPSVQQLLLLQYYSAKEKSFMVSLIEIVNWVDATAIGIKRWD
jgi:hypothetical protein